MDLSSFDNVRKKQYLIASLIILCTLVVLLLNSYAILIGITTIFPHLFYIPITLMTCALKK